MAKKVILKDLNDIEVLPITRGELVLDASGNPALHSTLFLATDSLPGLMSSEDKYKLDHLEESGPGANNKVAQINTTTDDVYRLLFSETADDTDRTEKSRKSANLTFNPSTGVLTLTGTINADGGTLNGNITTLSIFPLNNTAQLGSSSSHWGNIHSDYGTFYSGLTVNGSNVWTAATLNPENYLTKHNPVYTGILRTTQTGFYLKAETLFFRNASNTADYGTQIVNIWNDGTEKQTRLILHKTGIIFKDATGYDNEVYHKGNLKNLSDLNDDVVSGKYLPLSGGTVTGMTTIQRGAAVPLYINSVGDIGQTLIRFRINGSNASSIGVLTGEDALLRYNSDLTALYKILDTSNTGIINGTIIINGVSITPITSHQNLSNYVTLNTEQTISGVKTFSSLLKFTVADGTAPFIVESTTKVDNLNATYVGNFSASLIFKSLEWNNPNNYADCDNTNRLMGIIINLLGNYLNLVKNYPHNYGFLLSFNSGGDRYTGVQISINSDGSDVKIRDRWSSGSWNTWKTLAFTDSDIAGNAATADKLKNKVKIWGLDFDGSSDVNGVLTTNAYVTFNKTGSELGYIGLASSKNDDIYISSSGNLYINGNEDTFINHSGGNVGVGTTDPKYKLHVDGDIRGSSIYSAHTYINTGGNGIYLSGSGIYYHNANNSWVSDLITFDSGSVNLRQNTACLGTLSVTGTGTFNLAIETVAFKDGYWSGGIRIDGSETVRPSVGFHIPNLYGRRLFMEETKGDLMWECSTTGGKPTYLILHSGNYQDFVGKMYWANVPVSSTSNDKTTPTFANTTVNGIVTVNGPQNALTINSSGKSAYTLFIKMINPNMSTTYHTSLLAFGYDQTAYNVGYIGFKFVAKDSKSNMVTLGLHSVDHVLNITGNGFVGIGTEAPTASLSVNGHVHIGNSSYTLSSPWKSGIVIGPDGTDKIVATYLASATNGATIGAHNSALSAWAPLHLGGTKIHFRVNESLKMELTTSGQLAILKTGAAAHSGLVVGGDSSKSNISTSIADQTAMIQIVAGSGGSTNSTAIGFHNPGISSAVLEYRNTATQAGGFNFKSDDTTWGVGIGTTMPSERLHVVGNIYATGSATIGNGDNNKTIYLNGHSSSLRMFAWDSSTYIESGNKDFSGNMPLYITGYSGNNGSNLYINFYNTQVRGVLHVKLDTVSGNYNEGIRLYGTSKSGSWANIQFGCDPSKENAAHADQWLIGRDTSNNFVIRRYDLTPHMTFTKAGSVDIVVPTTISTCDHSLKIYKTYNYHPCLADSAGRPGISISGNYPYLWLTGGGVANTSHGATITLAAPDTAGSTNGSHKTWTFGVPGQGATWMDLAYGVNTTNPHHGIDNWQDGSKTRHRIMRWSTSPQNQVLIYGTGSDSAASLVVNSSRTDTWIYGASFFAPSMSAGHNVWINIGKANSTRNSFGLSWHHAGGDGSTSNYGALEIYNVGNLQRWYADKHTQFLGRVDVANIGYSTYNYDTAAMQIREYGYGEAQTDTWGYAPRLAWHWGGRVAAQIGLASNGYLYTAPLTGTTFYKLVYESGTWGINITGSATSATYASYLTTCYAGGQQTNPQTYFNSGIGVKVAMTGMSSKGTSYWSDTLWINGYSGGDVPNMCALHFNRDGTPRMFISAQSNRASSYGTFYEVITGYNIGSQSVNYATHARYVIADNNAQSPGYALLQSGSGRADASPSGNTWIYWDTLGGTASPWGILHEQYSNYISFYGAGNRRAFINLADGNIYATHFYENSDILLKLNILEILNADNIPQIKEFDWKESGEHSYGLIAQELEEQGYSELVSTKDDGYKTVNYSAALSLIVGKLQVKIKELEKEIKILKNKN